MANLAAVLKAEVARLARKELRAETDALKKTISNQRAEILSLKRRTGELEVALKSLHKLQRKASPAVPAAEPDASVAGLRFRPAGMAANRKRLGLSAADFGLLVGATGQSVYAWEAGKSKPRAQNLSAIAALRGIAKREVLKRLEAARQQETT